MSRFTVWVENEGTCDIRSATSNLERKSRQQDSAFALQPFEGPRFSTILIGRHKLRTVRLINCGFATLQGELYIIDVSQAVDLDHPRALDFLREDATHINAFFRRAGIAALTTRELFEFVVDPNIHAGNMQDALDRLAAAAASRPANFAAEDQTADNVRLQS